MTNQQKWQRACERVFEFAEKEFGKFDGTIFHLAAANPANKDLFTAANCCPHNVESLVRFSGERNHDALLKHEASGAHREN